MHENSLMSAPDPSRSEAIIRQHVLLAAGAGLIPVPLADLAAVTGVQVQMLAALSEHFGIPFSRHRTKSIVMAFLGSVASREIASIGFSAALKAVPGIGTMLGAASMPLASAALTYAIGAVFRDHFAAGGAVDDFNFDRTRAAFRRHLDRGKKTVRSLVAPLPAPVIASDPLKIYCILKPNIGKYGKVYLKTYVDGQRPEKYLGTFDELKARYGVAELETVKGCIIDDYREMFLLYLATRVKDSQVYESETIPS
ncbi:MAG: hypothetical protein CK538_10930 [Opitutia bacterium]|nr:DUF697 domain-containing protein [Opitutaceae bacterium]PHX84649.1 MAG: hypothetical protein CK538_10930 [Opitutae bacterium]